MRGVKDPKIVVTREQADNIDNHVRDTFFGEWPHMCAVQKNVVLGVSISESSSVLSSSGSESENSTNGTNSPV